MGNPLPHLSEDEFTTRLQVAAAEAVGDEKDLRPGWAGLLWQHYEEMRRWNPRLSLVGPGTAGDVVERHYAESLGCLSMLAVLDDADGERISVLDVGAGGGFPGLVLATARTDLDVVLVEPNQRKCAFLEAALRRLRRGLRGATPAASPEASPEALSCRVLNARVDGPVADRSGQLHHGFPDPGFPKRVDLVTSRALAWTPNIHQSLLDRWPTVRFMLWIGRDLPELPSGASVQRDIPLGSHGRIALISHP